MGVGTVATENSNESEESDEDYDSDETSTGSTSESRGKIKKKKGTQDRSSDNDKDEEDGTDSERDEAKLAASDREWADGWLGTQGSNSEENTSAEGRTDEKTPSGAQSPLTTTTVVNASFLAARDALFRTLTKPATREAAAVARELDRLASASSKEGGSGESALAGAGARSDQSDEMQSTKIDELLGGSTPETDTDKSSTASPSL